jgi:uncharacterized protein (TIGR03067 family)
MRTFAAFALGLGLVGLVAPAARAQDKKDDAPKLAGKYTLEGGKRNGTPIDDEAKKGEFAFTADRITIEGMGVKFVMSYTLDPKMSPVGIDMEIVDGPEGTKGAKAQGIVEVKGDTLKLAYAIDKDKRPKDFEGKEGFLFEFKRKKD